MIFRHRKFSKNKFFVVVAAVSLAAVFIYFDADLSSISKYPGKCLGEESLYKRNECLRIYFEDLTVEVSAEVAVAKAQDFKKQGIIEDCHFAAHYIGEANLVKYDYDTGQAFSSCVEGCIDGCFHGVMEAYISSKGDQKNPDDIIKLCQSVSKNNWLYRQCLHGVGHGLLRHESSGLLDAVVSCRKFADVWAQDTCIDGVLMQNMRNYLYMQETEIKNNLLEICGPLKGTNEENLLVRCVQSIGEGLTFYTGHDLEKSLNLCGVFFSELSVACKNAAHEEFMVNKSDF